LQGGTGFAVPSLSLNGKGLSLLALGNGNGNAMGIDLSGAKQLQVLFE
jgi:hypothetical protein